MKVIDISRSIEKKAPVYPGNWPVNLVRIKNFKKDGSNLSGISLGLHTATHLDAPPHYLKSRNFVDRLDLNQCFGWCRVIDLTKIKTEITEKEINRVKAKLGEIILLKTKNSLAANKKFDKKFIHITESAARALVKAGIKAVGIDGPSIRKFKLKPDTAHPYLLRHNITIYEGLNLKEAKAGQYYFFGLPLKIKDGEASPVRAILIKN